MERQLTLFLSTLLLCASALAAPPNVLLIVVDDMGWTGPACYGSDLHETRNIDRLASEGMRFTQAYSASPICTPTRASIMTGLHPARLHMTVWSENARSQQTRTEPSTRLLLAADSEPDLAWRYVTLAESFRERGYTTAHVGKWHLGAAKHYPQTQGFDLSVGASLWGAPRTYWHPYWGAHYRGDGSLREYRYMPGVNGGEEGEYLTDRLTDEAIAMLEGMGDKPFFVHMSYHNPHTPIEGKPELAKYYEGKITDDSVHRHAEYAAMVHTLDVNVGRLLDALERLGVADNTIVIFLSDNGGYTNTLDGQQITGNAPLRSGKGSLYEGGTRIPFIVKWPEHTRPGTVSDAPVATMDLYPTLHEMLGIDAEAPNDEGQDGLSLVPLLTGKAEGVNRDTLYWHYPHYYFNTAPVSAIRDGDWKLISYYEDDRVELYNLAEDPGEATNLSTAQVKRTLELRGKLRAWLTRVDANLPRPNPDYPRADS
jgi:arylsulfatase A-like enzyme